MTPPAKRDGDGAIKAAIWGGSLAARHACVGGTFGHTWLLSCAAILAIFCYCILRWRFRIDLEIAPIYACAKDGRRRLIVDINEQKEAIRQPH